MMAQQKLFKTVLVLVAIIAVVGVLSFLGPLGKSSPVETNTETDNSQIITAIERQEQIVLLSASVQGLYEEEKYRTVFGKKLPGSSRAEFLQYTYRAKIGIEGGDVRIKKTGENEFRIFIPEFISIGKDNMDFDTVAENNGLLSVVTEDIDTAGNISKILGDDAINGQIAENRELLEDQAIAFYTGIISGINDDIELEFEFED